MNAVVLLMWTFGLHTYGLHRTGAVEVIVMLGQKYNFFFFLIKKSI